MTSKKQSKSEDIVDGAFAVLLSEGLPPLSYDRIARAAGATRQLVRYHYPRPEDLMLALCDKMALRYMEDLTGGVAELAGADRLAFFFDYYFDLLEGTAKPRDDQVYDAMFSLSAGTPEIQGNLRGQYTLLGQTLTHEIKSCYPDIPLPSCGEISYLFVTIMYGHWKMVATLGLSEEHKHVARQAIDRIISSYLAKPEPIEGVTLWTTED